ncbi:ABC transporter permease [Sphingomonas oleivorans]|uniref:ABC transporter permease n=1 Tax=Sphingomonas oleivorans TaxID=1735121 RepID=A0A2T5G120_9SPHN|nr:ABC transporter permease [Sphingomonas oleivorans]PTQ12837.1 ABC transporter permease [Sphingomonas oleivorans]
MRQIFRAAWVIARRDYVATVWSKTFLLFLLGPLFPIAFGLFFGSIGERAAEAGRGSVAVIADMRDGRAIADAHLRLSGRLGRRALPELNIVAPEQDEAAQIRRLLADPKANSIAVLTGGLVRPALHAAEGRLDTLDGELALILDRAREARVMGAAVPSPVEILRRPIEGAAGDDKGGRELIARAGQTLLVLLIMILAGMLLSNLIEEKSNKVIEVLAAAVPIDAIFLGKLAAMLAMSLTGIFVWGGAAAIAAALFLAGDPGSIPAPAVGWSAFAALGLLYFAAAYLLVGALFLGIGGQASTVREVQTLSMPLTMGQLAIFALASTAIGAPDGPAGLAASAFPWSSPFAMIARAAERPELWPHLLAIGWQLLWLALIIRIASRLFRLSVLSSGRRHGWLAKLRARA